MFKVIVSDVESIGSEYFTTRRVAFGKSPKQCWERVHTFGQHTVSGGHESGLGGVPVMQERTLEKDGKIISQTWDYHASSWCDCCR